MSSATSASSPVSSAVDRLHCGVQRWIHDRGWTGLRPAQAEAVDPVLAGDRDVIISAPTAGGKTEAAFFPICSRLAEARDRGDQDGGVEVLYVSPLKALINDQYDRLELLCAGLDIPVHRWHGDVAASAKAKVRRSPSGIVIITPESVEALFVTAGLDVARILGGLRYIVVDELHAFLGTERGAQLQSLMHRAEAVIGRPVPRIALSATLASPLAAKGFLRPGDAESVRYICPQGDTTIKLRVFGHQRRAPVTTEDDQESSDLIAISEQIFRGMRGSDHLVFANSRSAVEFYSDRLARLSEQQRVPNEFFAHHGNLAKEEREHVEQRLKGPMPTTAICTSTLEMGVDIGSVDSVAQIGPPPSVAALRQRLGRSGRRGGHSVLMVHVSEPELDSRTSPLDELRPRLVQTVAMIELMGERYLEKPDPAHPHLSTLVQQILSVIAQRGGASAVALYAVLCDRGPFRQVSQSMFADLLRAMARADLLVQGSDGLLLAGGRGDRMVNHYSFYTAFHTPEEFKLVHGTRTIGTLPIDRALAAGSLILFGGRRWQVLEIDTEKKIVQLAPASGARPPKFDSGGGPLVADEVRQRMRSIYRSTDVPRWLDEAAASLLDQGRAAFARYGLTGTGLITHGTETLVLPWRGDKIVNTIAVLLHARGVQVGQDRGVLTVAKCPAADLRALFGELADSPAPGALRLAQDVPVKELDKHDRYITGNLLAHSYAARFLDVPNTWPTLRDLARSDGRVTEAPSRTGPTSLRDAVLGKTPFAVVDLETTGFDANGRDRVIEIAVVHLSADGRPVDRWSTLVQPDRSPGPTRLHGLTEADLRGAPRFAQIADELLARLDGAVLVAHNADFDRRFLHAELIRAGRPAPDWPTLCTRHLAYRLASATSRRLAALCDAEGLQFPHQHSALGDADATARLLTVYLDRARAGGRTSLAALGVEPLALPAQQAEPPLSTSVLPRVTFASVAPAGTAEPTGDPRLDAYLDLLEEVMADHVITDDEEDQLRRIALSSGLTAEQVTACRSRATHAQL